MEVMESYGMDSICLSKCLSACFSSKSYPFVVKSFTSKLDGASLAACEELPPVRLLKKFEKPYEIFCIMPAPHELSLLATRNGFAYWGTFNLSSLDRVLKLGCPPRLAP